MSLLAVAAGPLIEHRGFVALGEHGRGGCACTRQLVEGQLANAIGHGADSGLSERGGGAFNKPLNKLKVANASHPRDQLVSNAVSLVDLIILRIVRRRR